MSNQCDECGAASGYGHPLDHRIDCSQRKYFPSSDSMIILKRRNLQDKVRYLCDKADDYNWHPQALLFELEMLISIEKAGVK